MTVPSFVFCDNCGASNRTQARFCRSCGQGLTTLPGNMLTTSSTLTGLLSSQFILHQRYMILERVGSGGFGAVYKAMDTRFGQRLVAIKEMSQNSLDAKELVEATDAFKREAMLLANLTHPNLPRIYEQFNDGGRWYLVMDFIAGETLEAQLAKLQGKPMPVEKVLSIAIQLCSVLDYLHAQQPPIIFRDLKPANVMVTAGEHVYLIDFGIARHFKPGQAKDTTALGSLGYAAPEQYGRSQTTARADIYSLGATLHQLLTGEDPSESPFRFSTLQAPSDPVLAPLDKLVSSMVRVDVQQRPPNVTTVTRELQRIHTIAISTSGTLPPLPYKAPQGLQATMAVSHRRTTIPQVNPQLNTLYVCTGHSGRVTSVAWSPDGKYLASASYDKTVRIWDAQQGKHVMTYKGHSMRVNALAWSPDSKRIASASSDTSVQVWDITTGKPVFTYHGHHAPVRAVAWSPDGTYLASGSEDKTVQIWKAHNGLPVFTYHEHTSVVYAVTWSGDGKRIASAGKERRIHIWNPLRDTRSRSLFDTLTSILNPNSVSRVLTGHSGHNFALSWSPSGRDLASTGSDHRVVVWDMLSGHITFSQGENSASMKNAVAWSPHGKYLAVGGNDKTVQIWNTQNKYPTLTYSGHTGYVTSLAWSPDGSRVVSGGVDRTIQVWQAA